MRSAAPVPEPVAVAVNATGSGPETDAQSNGGQAACPTCTRPGPVGPSMMRRRPAPLPGSAAMVASGAATSPVAPVASPYPAMSVVAAPSEIPPPSVNGTR